MTFGCASITTSAFVTQGTQLINALRGHLHDLWPALKIPARVLITNRWQERIGMRVARSKQTARVRIARDELLGSATSYVLL